MPIVQISLVEGRGDLVIKECIKDVARVIHHRLGALLETIRVVVHQLPAAHWAVGDQTRDEIDAAKKATLKREQLPDSV
jgi:4-oxalocrotonate tautomerase